jgi:hypothetical protein
MNPVMFVLGLLLIGAGFVTLVRRLHDRSMHETMAVLRSSSRNVGPGIRAFAGLLVPIVTSIAAGVAFVVVGALFG